MVSTGTKIAATDFNTIQSLVNQVLGVNTGGLTYGYGQNVDSTQVSANSRITTTQWRNLRSDILRCRQHQTGTDLSASLTYPTADVKIYATDREAYLTMMQAAAQDANRLIAPPSNQASRDPLVATQTKTPPWNGQFSQTITVTFGGYTITSGTVSAADHARCYFNAGGRIELSSALSGGTSGTVGTKDYSWKTLLSGMGTVYFNRTDTTCTGTGTTSAIGWSGLTASDQVIFQKTSADGYAPNTYKVYARAPSSSQIIFTIYWQDLSTTAGVQSGGPPTQDWGIDENVTGSITSTIQTYRPSGTNVSVIAPTGTTSAL